MGAIMAQAAADYLIRKLTSAIENEASLIGGLRDELHEIKLEFISMRSFLEDADKKGGVLTQGERAWVGSIRDLAHEVEDAIDEFMYHVNKQHNGGKFTSLLYQTIRLPKNLWARHQIAIKLQKINRKIKSIDERRKRFAIERIEGTSSVEDQKTLFNYAESSFFIKEDKLVGIEDDNKLLVKWLTEEEQQCSTVISVVGMGGSGKTTLVSKAFNSLIVKRHFDCHAWITVSQKYVVDDLLRRMIEEFYGAAKETVPTNLNTMGFRELVSTLLSYLGAKRYLIILDDVWSSKLWEEINVSLPDEGCGSRVILTTRNENIASSSFGVKSHVHHVKPLGEKEAWELFSLKAFSNNLGRLCPQELQILARKLVDKCEGLPLALVALGSAMSSKKLVSEWQKVNNSLDFELRNNPSLQKMKLILLISFNELPYNLKHCFLYCCLFPEDYVLKRKRLIRLWMADRFVEKVKGITPEEVADSYLMELIHRNMLQVVRRNPSGRPKRCKLHDLLREIALSIAAAENFGALYDDEEASKESGARRLSIQTITEQIKSLNGMSKLRSLLVFIDYRISPSLVTLPTGLRLLRVLDLQRAPIKKLPDELGVLFNLRYLSLKATNVKELPKSIGRLSNLQTLDVAHTRIEVLPTGITNLKNLRYLVMFRSSPHGTEVFEYYFGIRTPPNIYKLKNLQVLSCVEAESDLMRRIRSMTQLTRFSITR
ncbi:unnamed protein product [Ilex paraguariensis]|uniref:Uncharacterized protein n=1 Tax=Ilex paraguariensis TaxID=185542 RepID=A0ABC8R0D0_9AQUA